MDGEADQKEDQSPYSDTAEHSNDANQQQAGDSSTDSHPPDDHDRHEEEDSNVLVQRVLAQHEQEDDEEEDSNVLVQRVLEQHKQEVDERHEEEDSNVLVQRMLAQHEQETEGPPSDEKETPPSNTTTTMSQSADGRGGEDESTPSAGSGGKSNDDVEDDVPTGENVGEGEDPEVTVTPLAAKPPSPPEGSVVFEDSTAAKSPSPPEGIQGNVVFEDSTAAKSPSPPEGIQGNVVFEDSTAAKSPSPPEGIQGNVVFEDSTAAKSPSPPEGIQGNVVFEDSTAAKLPSSPEGSVVFEDSTDADDGNRLELDLDTPKGDSARALAAGHPDLDDETEESKAAAATPPDEVDNMDYGDYLELYHGLQAERESLIQHSSQLQTKLLEYFHRQTGDVAGVHPEKQKPASEQEWRYQAEVGVLEELKRQYGHNAELAHQQAEQLKQQAQEKLNKVETEWQDLAALKQEVAEAALRRRLGRQAGRAEAERMLASERHRELQLTQARLKNIKLREGTRRLEAACGARGELPHGVEPLYFQQLKFENQKLLEKIEQRNEELLKLQRKIANYVGVLAHMKEKIHHSQTDNRAKRACLSHLEALVSARRDELTRLKQARDRARAHGQRLRQRCGLLGNRALLRDFQEQVDASLQLERDIEGLRHRHTLELERSRKTKRTRLKEKGDDTGYGAGL